MALVVEDGTGLSTAEAYISVADATTFIDSYYLGDTNYSSWGAASTAAQENALRIAAFYMDTQYGDRFVGTRVDADQALQFPRTDMVAPDGYSFDSDEVPTEVKRANAYLAFRYVVGDTFMSDLTIAEQEQLRKKSVEAGPIQVFKEYMVPNASFKKYTVVELLINKFLLGGGFSANVARG